MSTAIPNTPNTTSSASSTAKDSVSKQTKQSLTNLSNNFGSFLKLLTTQLKNQDPLSPMKTHEFTNQLVMFAEAEQAIATNKKLDQLIGIEQKNQASQALSYHGKKVRVKGDKLSFNGEPTSFQYTLPKGMASADLIVRDEAGKTVINRKLDASQFKEGKHVLSWDGRNQYGYQLANGLYTVSITGKDSQGKSVKAKNISVTATVKGVEYKDGKTWLDMGHYQVTLDNVESITSPGFKVEDQVRAMSFVGNHVHITGSSAPVKDGKVSLTYNTAGLKNFDTALKNETLKSVKLKFFNNSNNLIKTHDITASMNSGTLAGGEKRLDSVVSGLQDQDYRVEMDVEFSGKGTQAGSVFNKIPLGYSGKVRRVVFNNGEIRLEINNVLYNPSDIGSVVSSDTPIIKVL